MKFNQPMKAIALGLTALLFGQFAAQAQTPVDCGPAYVIATKNEGATQYLYSVPLNATPGTLVPIANFGQTTYNALAQYNGLLYAIDATGAVVTIDGSGTVTALPVTGNGLLGPNFTAGEVTTSGDYYILNNVSYKLVKINLASTPHVATEVADLTTALSGLGDLDDIAYMPAPINKFYGVTAGGRLVEIDLNGNLTVKNPSQLIGGIGTGTITRGTVFLDDKGNLYVGQNSTGAIFKISGVANPGPYSATTYSTPLTSMSNAGISPTDGARCAAAIVGPSAGTDDRMLVNGGGTVTIPVIAGKSDGYQGPLFDGSNSANTSNKAIDKTGSSFINNKTVKIYYDSDGNPDTEDPVLITSGSYFVPNKGTFTLVPGTGNNPDVVTFTPIDGFDGDAFIYYTVNDTEGIPSNYAKVIVWSNGPLSVHFANLSATLVNGQLVVNWTTLGETNNSYFEVQVSKDGKTFSTIGDKVITKATDGNSTSSLDYNFTFDVKNGGSLLGIAIFSMAFVALLFNRKNKMLYTFALVAGLGIFGFSSCSKSDAVPDAKGETLSVRVKQVDKDGKVSYSKAVQAQKQ
ncbi:MAG: hypothetical protein QM727_08090 [Niabella sp.]